MKKTYLCPQADIQKVETGILCSSVGGSPIDKPLPGDPIFGA